MSRKNLYQRGTTWWGRVKVGGREHRRSLRTTDPREAARRFKAWETKITREHVTEEETVRYKDAVLRWAKEVLPGAVKPAVQRRYLTSMVMLDATFGPLTLTEITPKRIAAYVSSRAGKVSNATIRRDLTALSRLLAACCAWGWLDANPVRVFDRTIIRERRDPIREPDPAAVALTMAALPSPMAHLLRLLAETGMRMQEATGLERGEVDEPRRQIKLVKTKTNRPRTIDITTPGGDATEVLALGAAKSVLFTNRDGGPYVNFSSNFGQVIRAVAEKEKAAKRPFRRFRVHDLRHAFAIRWLKAGGDIYRLSRHLGHTSVKTTEIYLSALTSDELDQVRGVGAKSGTVAQKGSGSNGKSSLQTADSLE